MPKDLPKMDLCFHISMAIVLAFIHMACAESREPCDNYINIGHTNRSVYHQLSDGDNALCDHHIVTDPSAWYRFKRHDGERIPEECVPLGFCGTVTPIWMKGKHPSVVGETVSAVACSNLGAEGDCCSWPEPMTVKKCEADSLEYFVYQLPRPTGCPQSYCNEDASRVCPPGQTWDPVKRKCISKSHTTEGTTTKVTLPTGGTSTSTQPSTTSTSATGPPAPKTTTSPPTGTTSTGATSAPLPTLAPTAPESGNASSLPVGLIIGLCFLSAAIGGLIAAGLLWLLCRRTGESKRNYEKDDERPPPYSIAGSVVNRTYDYVDHSQIEPQFDYIVPTKTTSEPASNIYQDLNI